MEEISENSTTDEKSLKTPETQHDKRKQSPSFSADNSPNSFQNPRLKSKTDEIGKNDGANDIPGISKKNQNIPTNPENPKNKTTEITIQTNLMFGANLTNNSQKFDSANMDFSSILASASLDPISSTSTTTSTTKNLIQSNIMIGTSIINNNQDLSVASNTRSGANRNSPNMTLAPTTLTAPKPIPPTPGPTPSLGFVGQASRNGMVLITLHEYTGFVSATTRTTASHWPLLLERTDTPLMRGKLEMNGFLFWNIVHIIFCVSTPERLTRLGLLQADFDNTTLNGKKAEKNVVFPQPMETSMGLEVLGLAINKRYPDKISRSMSSPALHTLTTELRIAQTPELQSDSLSLEGGEGVNDSAMTIDVTPIGTTSATIEGENRPPLSLISPQQPPAILINLESPEMMPNTLLLPLKDAPRSTTDSPTPTSRISPNWGNNFTITSGYKAPNNSGLRPGSNMGVSGRSASSPLDHLILDPVLGVMKRSELLSQHSAPPPSDPTTQDTQGTHRGLESPSKAQLSPRWSLMTSEVMTPTTGPLPNTPQRHLPPEIAG
jgi:hypothetical protein